jgi:predicted SnoaL-like aldol condensation-catalyzing enzyme
MNPTVESKNKALVLEAFDTLFNKRDYAAAERYWSPNYIQHSAHIEPGRDGLFNLIKSIPPTLRYEPGTIVAEKDFVIVHGRFSGFGQPVNWIAADIVRIENGVWSNIGMLSKTRLHRNNQRVVNQCSAISSRPRPTTSQNRRNDLKGGRTA